MPALARGGIQLAVVPSAARPGEWTIVLREWGPGLSCRGVAQGALPGIARELPGRRWAPPGTVACEWSTKRTPRNRRIHPRNALVPLRRTPWTGFGQLGRATCKGGPRARLPFVDHVV